MIADSRIISTLEKSLAREISLYEEYLKLIAEERGSIIRFKAEKVRDCSERREQLHDAMKEAHSRRLEILEQVPDSKHIKLTDLIEQQCLAGDRKKLLPLAHRLKKLVQQTQQQSKDCSSVVRFGMGIVDSLLSIIWSATKHVSRGYSRQGKVEERTQPTGDRKSSVLKSA